MEPDKGSTSQTITLVVAGLILFYLLAYVLPLNQRPLTIPDETRYAEVPYEMLVSGDWVTPRLNGLRYFEKPPLGYWVNAISIKLLGDSNFAVRIPTALAAGLTAILIYFFSLQYFSRRKIAVFAAFVYTTFLSVYLFATHSTLDSLFNLFITAGIMSYVIASLELRPRRALLFWVASGVSLGLAFLTKGFLAFALPVLVLVPWLIWRGQWRSFLVKGWLVMLIAVLTVLPWGIMIHQQEGDFWHYFFWVEHIKRFSAENAQHKEPFYYFILFSPLLIFPWFGLLPAAVAGMAKTAKTDNKNIHRLLWFWVLIPFLFFSISSGKLATYILPCFPPLAILIASGLYQYFQEPGKHYLFKWGVGFNLLVCSALLAVIIFLQTNADYQPIYRENETLQLAILIAFIFAALLSAVISFRQCNWGLRVASMLIFLLPVIVFSTISVPANILENKAPGSLILEAAPLIDEHTVIISSGSMVRAVSWYLKRQDVYLLSTNEVAYGLSYPDSSFRLLDKAAINQLILNKQQKPVAIFCRKGCPKILDDLIPTDAIRKVHSVFEFILIR